MAEYRRVGDVTQDLRHCPRLGRPSPGGAEARYFVVTHTVPTEWVKPGSPFTFVTDGVESAVEMARKATNGKNVDLMGTSIVQQCLNAGLLDEIQIDLAPVLLGGGVRLFDYLDTAPIDLEPLAVVQGLDVTHRRCRVIS